MIAYESIGVKINGLVCDGGGANESFLQKVVDSFNLDQKFPNNLSVSMIHPLDKSRRIFVWSCGTHSLKAMRNNLFRSKDDGTRHLKLHKTLFGWKDVESIYLRDEERAKRNELKRTTITKQTVSLDNFTMMNATYAKQPFTDKTISEVISFFSVQLFVKVNETQKYESKWHEYNTIINKMLPVLQSRNISTLTSQFGLLQYQVAVFGIFQERLLNKAWRLNHENIDNEEKVMKDIIAFFYDWRTEVLLNNANHGVGTLIGEKSFIARKIFQNLVSLVFGFIGYARCMLLDKDCNEFFPSLHCNQSSIENLFSNIRMMGKDRTDIYGNGIMQQNVKQNIKMGKVSISSTSYDGSLQMESTNPQFYDSIFFKCYRVK